MISIAPGAELDVHGAFSQTSTGTLAPGVGPVLGAAKAGSLKVTGASRLGGTLAVSPVPGYLPTPGRAIPFFSYASESGSFASVTGLDVEAVPIFRLDVGASLADLAGLALAAPTPDLAVASVAGPSGSVEAGAPIAVSFTVANRGGLAAPGSWTDSVYLSKTGSLAADAILIGRVTHAGGLAAGASYSAMLTAPLPAALGTYRVLVLADGGQVVADPDRSDNLAEAGQAVAAAFPTLAVRGTVSGTLEPGRDRLYRVDVPAGTSVGLTLVASAGSAMLLSRAGQLSTLGAFDQYGFSPSNPSEPVTVGGGQGGPVYVLVHPSAGVAAGARFTLSAPALPFAAASFSPGEPDGPGSFTLAISGSGFTPITTASLVQGTTVVKATAISYQDSGTILATFADPGEGQFKVRRLRRVAIRRGPRPPAALRHRSLLARRRRRPRRGA